MQLYILEKYKEKLNVLSEGHLSPLTNSQQRPFARNVEILLVFSGTVVAFLPRKTLFILTLPTLAQKVQD
jgi:hypothetical protein